ncbi:anaerobic dimethyl sulfoxide reductase subunit C (anchor subunit) [Rubrivivax gelatinosus]|uniref:Anaerobic dimethyl sulfoxide reductase subunit C (Anchor subunit) n=1 Tax=Rubrivivax gelatinosus TaxID=28068 RepID=A0A4R2LYG1_RUBGE|nr:DmsC/YnfH family molybdoenzyme membrane anchor subunit [Rubrivivax gelatinosus]TCO99708.1 anaerobic dimethyl sulfoxide reductase subunit C (anchor subunit) [Rubrivivax gelatinosus]
MGWHEWPLILFTVIAQTAMGAFWWCFAALMAGGLDPERRHALEKRMIVVWALVAVGFGFAAFRLGSPLRFINASFRFGAAAFSNEVVFGSLFACAGIATWYLAWKNLATVQLRNRLHGLTLLLSAGFLYGMCSFYLMPTVPTWNTPLTPVAYVLTALIGGGAVAAALFAAAGIDRGFLKHGPLKLAALAVGLAVLVTITQANGLATIASSIKQASALTPDYAALMALRFAVLFSVLGLWIRASLRGQALTLQTGLAYGGVLMLAEMVGRGVFYNLHMTVGLR